MSVDIFQPIISADQIEDGALAFIEEWLPVYLREMEVQTGRDCGSLPLPRSYQVWDRLSKFEEDQLPALMLICPGIAGKPVKRGDGSFAAWWKMQVALIVSTNDQDATRQLARVYGAAIRALVIQKPSFGDIASGTLWTGENYDVIGNPQDSRTIAAVTVDFNIYVDNVVNQQGGPRTYPNIAAPDPRCPPDGQPGSSWPEAETVTVTEIIEGVGR